MEDQATLVKREAQKRVSRMEVESTVALASACGEAKDLTRRIALLEGELAEARQARDTTKENSQGLSDVAADAERRLEESKRVCWEHVEELILLQTRGSELCLTIVGPLRVRSHLLEGMLIAALHHNEMLEEFAALRAAVSSIVKFALRHSPNDTFQVEGVDELIAECQK
jgi:hypothetical protein